MVKSFINVFLKNWEIQSYREQFFQGVPWGLKLKGFIGEATEFNYPTLIYSNKWGNPQSTHAVAVAVVLIPNEPHIPR